MQLTMSLTHMQMHWLWLLIIKPILICCKPTETLNLMPELFSYQNGAHFYAYATPDCW